MRSLLRLIESACARLAAAIQLRRERDRAIAPGDTVAVTTPCCLNNVGVIFEVEQLMRVVPPGHVRCPKCGETLTHTTVAVGYGGARRRSCSRYTVPLR